MKYRNYLISMLLSVCIFSNVGGQNRDKAIFRESKPGFYQNSILRDDREVKQKAAPERPVRTFTVDLTSGSFPDKMDLYKTRQWHNSPVS